MKKILFVCLGNICRSPLAEAIFQEKIVKSGLEQHLSCDSAGTAGYHIGENPDPRSIEVATKHGVPISHKGQQFVRDHQHTFDYLIAMDQSNLRNMILEIGHKPENLKLMREFDPLGKNQDVPDPYYGGKDGFEDVFQMLDRSCDEFLKFLIAKHNL